MWKSHTNLDRAGVEKTASTAAGSEATEARAVLPGPTSQSSKDKTEIYSAYLYMRPPRRVQRRENTA